MKIVNVNPWFFPFEGGIEHIMHDTSKMLVERGHDVTILTAKLPDTKEEEITPEGYKIIRLESKMRNLYNPPFISSKGVLEALNSIDADVALYNYRWAPSYTRDMSKYDGKKVFMYHNIWGEGTGLTRAASVANDIVFDRHLRNYDHIIAVSDYVKSGLVKHGYREECVTTMRPGLEPFPETTGPGDGEYILSLGRLVHTKGLDYLVKAMKDVDMKLILCGKGPEAEHLKKLASKMGLENKIEFKGWVSLEEKNELMRNCRMFVMPSLFEAFGIAAAEIMAYGRPVIHSNVNGLPDTVGDGGIGVPPRDPAALAKAMNTLAADRALCDEYGKKARKRAEEHRWEKSVLLLEDVFKKVVDGEYRRPVV